MEDIATLAEVSKGSLFNYFDSKKNLFLYMFDYSVNFLLKNFVMPTFLKEKDFFKRIMEIQKFKLGLTDKYPYIINFLELSIIVRDIEIQGTMLNKITTLINMLFNHYFDDIDITKFNEGMDVQKVYKLFEWFAMGYFKDAFNKNKGNIDRYAFFNEYVEYLDIFRRGVYKKEFHNENINALDYIKK